LGFQNSGVVLSDLFERALSHSQVDIAELCSLCRFGVPNDLRALVWRLVLGAWPEVRDCWAAVAVHRAEEYADVVRAAEAVRAVKPGMPKDQVLLAVVRMIAEFKRAVMAAEAVPEAPEMAKVARVFSGVLSAEDAYFCFQSLIRTHWTPSPSSSDLSHSLSLLLESDARLFHHLQAHAPQRASLDSHFWASTAGTGTGTGTGTTSTTLSSSSSSAHPSIPAVPPPAATTATAMEPPEGTPSFTSSKFFDFLTDPQHDCCLQFWDRAVASPFPPIVHIAYGVIQLIRPQILSLDGESNHAGVMAILNGKPDDAFAAKAFPRQNQEKFPPHESKGGKR
jgi:hypothetical protein